MKSTRFPHSEAGAGRGWVGRKVLRTPAERNSSSSFAAPASGDGEPSSLPATPTSRLLEISCGLSAEQVRKLLEPAPALGRSPVFDSVQAEYSPGRLHEYVSAVTLVLMVTGLLVFALS